MNKRLANNKKNFYKWLFYKNGPHDPDYTLLVVLGLILIFGLVFLASASWVTSFEAHQDPYFLLKEQFFKGIFFGFILFFICSHIDYNFWRKNAWLILLVGIGLLLLVFIPTIGKTVNNAQRWINLFGFSFQPSEFIKLALIIYLSAWFASKKNEIKDFSKVFIPFVIIVALIAFLIMLQPDMGTTLLVVAICLSLYFLAGGQIGLLAGLSLVGGGLFYFLIKKAAYRANRLMVYLNPELDPLGIGYHINQAILAVGSGGIFGRGLGRSRQKFNYLPEVASDSIFAVIAEELGFIFTFLFLLFYFYFFYLVFRLSKNAPDEFSRLMILGVFVLLVWQSLLNIMAMLGLVPLTGAPLPLISYGSSSMVIILAGLGIVFNISQFTKNNKAKFL